MNGLIKECNDVSNGCLSELERENNMSGKGGRELAITRKIGLGWKAFNSMPSML